MIKKIILSTIDMMGYEIRRIPPVMKYGGGDINEVEKCFIEFMSKKTGRSDEVIKAIYLETRDRFKFGSVRYHELCTDFHNLVRILYDDDDEKGMIDSYGFHELIHLFMMISYSYDQDFERIAASLIKKMDGRPITIVDYGCGLGYISHEIGRRLKDSKVYLVDIDTLILEFAKFRFDKRGIDTQAIPVTKNDLYPKLPAHNICIATEVMEHLTQPLKAYSNICESMEKGGILAGDFEDHRKEMFHVSCELDKVRDAVVKSFRRIDDKCYRKI